VSQATDVKCERRMDAAGAVDAQNASTAPWKTAAERGFPQRPHASSCPWTTKSRRTRLTYASTCSTHEIPDSPSRWKELRSHDGRCCVLTTEVLLPSRRKCCFLTMEVLLLDDDGAACSR